MDEGIETNKLLRLRYKLQSVAANRRELGDFTGRVDPVVPLLLEAHEAIKNLMDCIERMEDGKP